MAKSVLLLVVVVFLVAAVMGAFEELRNSNRSVSVSALTALPVLAGSLVFYALAWARALETRPNPRFLRAVVASQLTRYVPGAIWQPVTQVIWTTPQGSRSRNGTTTYVTFLTGLLASASVVGGTMAFSGVLERPWRFLAAVGFLGTLFLMERPLAAAGVLIDRFIPRIGGVALPNIRTRAAIFAAGVVLTVLQGIALWICLAAVEASPPLALVIPGFAAAWALGIVAVPLPAGLGMRELVLGVVLAGSVPLSLVILGSLVMRLVGIVAELLLFVGFAAALGWKSPPPCGDRAN